LQSQRFVLSWINCTLYQCHCSLLRHGHTHKPFQKILTVLTIATKCDSLTPRVSAVISHGLTPFLWTHFDYIWHGTSV
jgi:hypothetical protein